MYLDKLITVTPVSIYLLQVSSGNTRTRCEICSKLTIKIPEPQLTVTCSKSTTEALEKDVKYVQN